MKKFTLTLLAMIFALFVVSCGDGKKETPETPDTDDTDTVPDDDADSECEGDDCGDTGDTCTLGNELYTINADRYFAFKGMGTINPANALQSQTSQSAASVKVAYDGIPGASFTYAGNYSFYEYGYSQMVQADAITLNAVGDVTSASFIATLATVTVPLDYLTYMQENEIFELDQAPITEVAVLKWSKDSRFVQQCIYFGKVDATGQYFNGKMKVCHDKNKEFAQGETFKMSMVAEIGSDEDTAGMFSDIETVEDLCPCFDLDLPEDDPNNQRVDCDTINWNGGAEEPECDAETEELKDGKCECKEGFEREEENGKCVAKEEEADPCKDVTCENEGEVCVADAEAENGYKCEVPAPADPCDPNPCEDGETCAAADNAAGYTCTPAAPVNPDKAACEAEGGTWAETTCNCADGKMWNETEKKCETPVIHVCEGDYEWNPETGNCEPPAHECEAAEDCGENQICDETFHCVDVEI